MRTRTMLFPWRTFYRLTVIQSSLVLLSLASTGLSARYFFHKQFLTQVRTQLRDSLELLASGIEPDSGAKWCEQHRSTDSLHFWLVGSHDQVLCGSDDVDPASLPFASLDLVPNISTDPDRPIRLSVNRKSEFAFGELLLPGEGKSLRAAIGLGGLRATLHVVDTSLGITLFVVALALGLLSVWTAKQLVFPLGRLLVKTRSIVTQNPEPISAEDLKRETFGEWVELESNIDTMRRNLAAKVQRLSREQFELGTVMGAISDAIIAVDLNGTPLFYNSRFEILFGKQGLADKTLKLWGLFREPRLLDSFQTALKQGQVSSTQALGIDAPDGSRRYFQLSVSPLRKRDGNIYAALGVFHDVTDLKSAEQMRIDFVANVSHELRTPLTVIKGYADTLVEDLSSQPEALEQAKSIARNADRLTELMGDLLDLSSIESDSTMELDRIDCSEVTERIVDQLRSAFMAKQQTVTVSCETSEVYADLQRLEQVLVNLLTNASKYTQAGGAIKVRWYEEPRGVVLCVSDNGRGIPAQHQGRLFERFYRIDRARSRESGGTGLGLAIVKHIMRRHGGSVSVESEVGRGTSFFCHFPKPT